jgi:DNA-binding SARP family transcriptional activator
MFSVSLLGGLCIRNDDAPVAGVDTPRLQALLAFLLLYRDAPQLRSHLAFLFWPDTSEAQARTNLRNLLHRFRQSLPQADAYLETGIHTIQWTSDTPFFFDVAQFEAAIVHAKELSPKGNLSARREALEQAIAVYKGDLLPSCYDDWIIPHREALRQTYLSTLEQIIQLLEEQRDYQGAIQYGRRLLREDPLQEATYRNLIRLNALNGNRAGALRLYHTCTTLLQRELDVSPSLATREVYRQLLGGTEKPCPSPSTVFAFSPLVGRDSEWMHLLHAWRNLATGGEPHLVILRGEAGIGKTRLVEELFQWASRQGITSASTRCYAAEGDLAYAPVIAWLRSHPLAAVEDVWLAELARLLPEILTNRQDLPKPVALTEAWQRQHLFEALARAILGMSQPLLLTVDDLQWGSRDLLEWLRFLLHFDRSARFMLVGTYRPEEIVESHPLNAFLQALRPAGQLTEMELQPLDETATQSLGSLVAGVELSPATAHFLYQETEGNPLFVVEIARAGLPEKILALSSLTAKDNLPAELGLPPKVQSVLEARLAQLSPPARKLAGLAATIGREFDFKLLSKASGEDENELVLELDELWQRRIVREHSADAYDFSHDKLREVVYSHMSIAQRQLLHRHVAQALEALYTPQLEPVSHHLAAHYERAGLLEKAVAYYLLAARVSRQVYANSEAITLLKHGLMLIDSNKPSVNERMNDFAAQSLEELGDVLELIAQHDEALQAYREAQSSLYSHDLIGQSRIYCKIGIVLREQRSYQEALESCRYAEHILGIHPQVEDTRWWDQWLEAQVEQVWAHYWLAQWPEMEALVYKIQPDVQARGSPGSRMRFLMGSSLLHLRKERYVVSDEMISNTREALALSLTWGSIKNRLECQFEIGFLHLWRRELTEADDHLQAALDLAETTGILPMHTLILTYLTVHARFTDRLDGAAYYVQCAQQAALTAHMPDYVAAANGNQAWLAWRKGDLHTAEQKGLEALLTWEKSPLVYPFQWQALWPLIGVAMEQGQEDKAWSYTQKLLEPTQQLLPDELNASLGSVIRSKEMGDLPAARFHLERAMYLATQMGYL